MANQSPPASDLEPEDGGVVPFDPATFVRKEAQRASMAAMSSFEDDPEQAARAQELAKVTGAHPALVYGDLDNFEQQHKASLTNNIVAKNEFLQKWINDHPLAAKVSNDDIGQLDAISQKVKSFNEFYPHGTLFGRFLQAVPEVGEVARSGIQSIMDIPAQFAGVKPAPEVDELIKKFAEQQDVDPEQLEAERQLLQSRYQRGEAIQSALFGIGQVLASPVIGSFQHFISKPLEESTGFPAQATEALTIAGLAGLGIHSQVKGIKRAEADLKTQELTDTQQAMNLMEYIKAGKEPPAGISPAYDQLKIMESEKALKDLQELEKEAQSSNTKERSPDLYAEYIRGHGDSQIAISARKIQELYGDKLPAADDNILGWVPDLAERLPLEVASNGYIEIPLADWVAKADPEIAKTLHDEGFIRARRNSFSKNEIDIGKEIEKEEKLPSLASGQSTLDAVRASLHAEPMFDRERARKLQLKRAEEQYGTEGQHEFDIIDLDGKRVGRTNITESEDGKTLTVEWIGGKYDIMTQEEALAQANTFGPRAVRDLLAQLKQEFPEAKTLTGMRVSGARTGPARDRGRPSLEPTIDLVNTKLEDLDRLAFQLSVFSNKNNLIPVTADFTPRVFVSHEKFNFTNLASFKARDAIDLIQPDQFVGSIPKALYKFFGERIKELAGDVNIRVVPTKELHEQYSADVGGFYSPHDHEVVFPASTVMGESDKASGRFFAAEALIHELSHAVTFRAIKAHPETEALFVKLMKEADEYMTANLPGQRKLLDYAFTNVGEFVAESWSRQDLQQTLSHIPISDQLALELGLRTKGQTIWHAIREVIANILEKIIGERPSPTVLDGVLMASEKFQELHAQYPKLREPYLKTYSEMLEQPTKMEPKLPSDEVMRDAGFSDYEIRNPKNLDPKKLREINQGYGYIEGNWRKITQEDIDKARAIVERNAIAKAKDKEKLDAIFAAEGDQPRTKLSPILGSDWQSNYGGSYKQAAYHALETKYGYSERALPRLERIFALGQEYRRPLPPAEGITDTEPPATQKPVGERPVIKTPGTFGLTPEQYRRYQKLIDQRMKEDQAAGLAKAVKEENKKQSKEWKANEAAMRTEVSGDIYSRPDVAANEYFRTGTLFGQKGKTPRVDPSFLTPEQKKGLPPEYVRRGGYDPDDLAGIFGYQSGSTMIDRVIMFNQAQKASGKFGGQFIDLLVDKETDRRMQERYGDLGHNVLQEAKDQVMNDTQLDIIHEDILALAERAKAELPFDRAGVKAWVKEKFRSTKMKDVDSDTFISDAGKIGTQAELHLLRGDYGEAFKAKQQQYIAALKAKEAVRIEKLKTQWDRNAKRYAKREVSSTDQSYTNWIHDILMRVGEDVKRTPQDLANSISKQRFKTLEEFVQDKESMLREVAVADLLLDPKWKAEFGNLTVDEFQAVHDSVKSLIHNGKDAKKMLREGEAADLDNVLARIHDQLKEFGSKPYAPGGGTRRLSVLRTFVAAHMQVESLVNRWDKGDPFGLFTTHVTRDLIDSANQEALMEKKFSKKLKDIADNVDLNKKIENDVFMDPFSVERGEPTPIFMTRKNLRAIMQHLGNESNFDKLAKGYLHVTEDAPKDQLVAMFKQQIMDWVHKNATKEDWDWASKQGKIFAELKEESDAMYRRVSGIEPESLPLRPVQTPFGEYPGWYHPLDNHPLWKGSAKSLMGPDPLEEGGYFRATTSNRYTKKRTGAAYPLALDLDMTPVRMKQMIHDINFREALIQSSKIIYDSRFINAVSDFYGKEYADLFVPWLRDIAGATGYKSAAQKTGARALEFFRQNIITTLIGLNIGTVLKHTPTAAINSMTEVGSINFLKEFKSLLSMSENVGESNWAYAINKSAELQRRSRHYQETLGGAQDRVLGELSPIEAAKMGKLPSFMSLRESAIKAGATPVAFFDLLSAVPTWLAQYKTSIREGLTEGDAVYMADRAVRRAHGSTAITSRPGIAREGGALGAYMSSLYGFFSHIWNRQFELAWKTREAAGLVKEGDYAKAFAEVPRLGVMLFSYVLAPAIIEELVTPLTNEEKESWGKKAAKALAFAGSSSWVGVRDAVRAMLELRDPQAGLISAPIKTFTDLTRDVSKFPQNFDKQHMGNTIQHSITMFGAATGLTNAPEGRAAKFIHNYAVGIEKPRGWHDWYHGLRFGTTKERH